MLLAAELKDRLDALVNEVNAVPAKVTTVATKLTNSNALVSLQHLFLCCMCLQPSAK
jgi:hypothetical protein